MSPALANSKAGGWERVGPELTATPGKDLSGGWHVGVAAVKAQHVSGYRCWLRLSSA